MPVHSGVLHLWVLAALAIQVQAPADIVQDQVNAAQVDGNAQCGEDDLRAAGRDEQQGL